MLGWIIYSVPWSSFAITAVFKRPRTTVPKTFHVNRAASLVPSRIGAR
jgi:hypothetical protein